MLFEGLIGTAHPGAARAPVALAGAAAARLVYLCPAPLTWKAAAPPRAMNLGPSKCERGTSIGGRHEGRGAEESRPSH